MAHAVHVFVAELQPPMWRPARELVRCVHEQDGPDAPRAWSVDHSEGASGRLLHPEVFQKRPPCAKLSLSAKCSFVPVSRVPLQERGSRMLPTGQRQHRPVLFELGSWLVGRLPLSPHLPQA